MAAKRRTIVKQDLNFGYGQTMIPTDSGGVRAATKVGLDTFNGQLDIRSNFLAAGDGVRDDTDAFRAAYTAANTGFSSDSVGGQAASLSKPTMWLGNGIYRITGSIDNGVAGNGMRIAGDGAIIELAAGITFLDNIRYFLHMEGVSVRGGAKHIGIKTGNNECQIVIKNCEFMYPSSRIFDIDNNSASTQLLIKNCRLFTNSLAASQVMVALTGDYILFEDCFMKCETAAASAIDVTNAHLFFIRTVGVPQNLHSWVTLRNSSFYSDPLCRFGGEDGGMQFAAIVNYGGAYTFQEQLSNTIHVDGSEIYSLGTLIYFYAIPNVVIVENCTGLPGTDPFKIDAAVTAAQLSRIGENTVFKIDYNAFRYSSQIDPDGSPVIARESLPLIEDRMMLSGIPDTADLVLQSGGNTASYAPATTSINATLGTTTDQFAVPIRTITATAVNGSGSWEYTTALNGLAAGVYTAVFDIEITGSTAINAAFKASNTITWKQFNPTRGRHSVCIPFYYDGVGTEGYLPKSISIYVGSMPNAGVLRWHRFRIYAGRRHVPGPCVEVYGTAAPTTGQWYRGDKVYNTAKITPGLPGLWACLVAGSPGVWGCDFKAGAFTMDAAATKVVTEAEIQFDGATYSNIALIPNSPSAIALQGSAAGLYVAALVDAVSFTVATGNGASAAGTEVFIYTVMN